MQVRRRLALIQEAHGTDAWQEVPDATGEDREGRLRIVLDASARVVGVRVLDVGRLRFAAALSDALRDAWLAADTVRLSRSLTTSGAYDEWLRLGRERLSGARPLAVGGPRRGSEVLRARTLPGSTTTSINGFVTVRRSGTGDLTLVAVDQRWLAAARPEHLERALLEASTGYPKAA
jgi:hypothetical protein